MVNSDYRIVGSIYPDSNSFFIKDLSFRQGELVVTFSAKSASGHPGDYTLTVKPERGFILAIKTIVKQRGRWHIFYRIIDVVTILPDQQFRIREYARHTHEESIDDKIPLGAEYRDPPEEYCELISARVLNRDVSLALRLTTTTATG